MASTGVAGALRTIQGAASRSGRLLRATFDGGYRPGDAGSADDVSLTLDGVAAGYGRRLAIEGITGAFAPGSLTAVVGPNGAGKTTLLNLLAGVTRPRAGRFQLEGAGAHAIGYMPQVTAIDRQYPISVLEFAALGRWRGFGAFRTPPYELLPEVTAALRTVGMHEQATARIGELSLGQFRRVLFARLIVQRARLVLLDEPFAAVDARTTADLLTLLRAWHEEGRTVIAVLHDIEQVRASFPSTLLLARRVIAWGETEAVLTGENLAAAGLSGPTSEPRLLRLVPA